MKQHTTPEQTFKLISLGCDKPKHFIEGPTFLDSGYAYTIGELIEILPKQLDNPYKPPLAMEFNGAWRVYYGVPEDYSWEWSIWYEEERNELIDALYEMIIKLKEEGVI